VAPVGRSLRDLVERCPDELVGRGWRGPKFPVLTKFIDGAGMLPVHLHADDDTARPMEGEPNGKTEAWHILDAGTGATALVGIKEGVDTRTLRDALLRQDFDGVMRRVPVRAGETIYVPGGTLHSFGPRTLVYEIEQTSDIQQHAMAWRMEDGSPVPPGERRENIGKLLEELKPGPRPVGVPPLRIGVEEDVDRQFCAAGPFFVLERWRAGSGAAIRHGFDHAVVLSNVGGPATVRAGHWAQRLGRAASLLLPAALGEVTIEGPADVLIGYVPDLERDVRRPLKEAGYADAVIAGLGEGL
jgi:mannose-6-phosphate isomerase